MDSAELEVLAKEYGVSADVLRMLASNSGLRKDYLSTKDALTAALLKSGHITPADGNVFADLGFPPAEADRLLAEADAELAKKRRPGRGADE